MQIYYKSWSIYFGANVTIVCDILSTKLEHENQWCVAKTTKEIGCKEQKF